MEFFKAHKGSLAVVAALMAGAVGLAVAGQEPPKPRSSEEARINEAIPSAGELKNLALKYDGRIGALEQRLQESQKGIRSLQEALAALSGILEELRRPAPLEPSSKLPLTPLAPGRLLAIELKDPQAAGPALHIPAGSFGEATLLTGVYAPVTGDAMPVLIRLDVVLTGPNHGRVPIQQALLLGKAIGDANTSRAVIQLTTLSFVASDGTSRERAINGYVVDADGIQGLQGEYIWNAKQLVGLSVLSGLAAGASGALGQAQSTVITGPGVASREVTRDMGLFVGGAGASRAFENIGKIIEERMKEFVPAIHVGNRERKVTVVFLQGATIEGVRPEPLAGNKDWNLGGFDR